MNAVRRHVVSLSSWFCVPDQGMRDFEILCRASAFLLPAKWSKSKYHLLTVSHGVAPWKSPKLYPEEWLRFVDMRHTRYTAEVRGERGEAVEQIALQQSLYLHPRRDLAITHFAEEEQALQTLRRLGVRCDLRLREEDELPRDFTEEIEFHGHEVTGQGIRNRDPLESDDRIVLPRVARGHILGKTAHQIFARTQPTLVDGMCGGPVCRTAHLTDDATGHIVCGLVEGIVPATHPSEIVRNAAVFVESGDIRRFIADVEAGKIEAMTAQDNERNDSDDNSRGYTPNMFS